MRKMKLLVPISKPCKHKGVAQPEGIVFFWVGGEVNIEKTRRKMLIYYRMFPVNTARVVL